MCPACLPRIRIVVTADVHYHIEAVEVIES